MKKIILCFCMLIFSSCTVNIIWAPKETYQIGTDNESITSGSDLKDVQASQSADGQLDLPFIK